MLPASRTYWPSKRLEEILNQAIQLGSTRIYFDNISDAESFRFACYNFRRRTRTKNNGIIPPRLKFLLNPAAYSVTIKRITDPAIRVVEVDREENPENPEKFSEEAPTQ